MNAHIHIDQAVLDAIDAYLGGHTPGGMISMRAALQDIRGRAPQNPVSDEQLSEAIAFHAISRHQNISFDRGAPLTPRKS